MKLFCSWIALKNIKDQNSSSIYYYETSDRYEILTPIGESVWYTEIWKNNEACLGINTDQNLDNLTDFETNFKDNAQLLS